MVVGLALRVAVRLPVTQSAVVDRLGVGRGAIGEHQALEASFDAPVVGGELREPEALARPRPEDHVRSLGRAALARGEQLRVEA